MRSRKYKNWRVKCDENGFIWIWCDHKFTVGSMKIDEVHEYLLEFVGPSDDIAYVGFKEEELKIKGKKFLEVMNES